MESESSQLNHNCFSCSEGYLKSYEYIGNCYKINKNEIDSDKIIINRNDKRFTIVESCAETEKKLKINATGECVSQCPKINNVEQMKKNFISKIRKNLLKMHVLMNITNFILIVI